MRLAIGRKRWVYAVHRVLHCRGLLLDRVARLRHAEPVAIGARECTAVVLPHVRELVDDQAIAIEVPGWNNPAPKYT